MDCSPLNNIISVLWIFDWNLSHILISLSVWKLTLQVSVVSAPSGRSWNSWEDDLRPISWAGTLTKANEKWGRMLQSSRYRGKVVPVASSPICLTGKLSPTACQKGRWWGIVNTMLYDAFTVPGQRMPRRCIWIRVGNIESQAIGKVKAPWSSTKYAAQRKRSE